MTFEEKNNSWLERLKNIGLKALQSKFCRARSPWGNSCRVMSSLQLGRPTERMRYFPNIISY